MKPAQVLLLACLSSAVLPALAQHHGHGSSDAVQASPYAGEQTREIKALSAQEQRAWTEGQGMGLARAAELNGYPGPMHVLELARQLKLTDSQATATRMLMDAHKAEVRTLGAEVVDAERQLDALFRDKQATDGNIRHRTETIAQLQARIRAAHLATHVKQTQILTTEQVAQYNKLRGYQ